MFIAIDGSFYIGDMRPGDRVASTAEIQSIELSRMPNFDALKAVELASYINTREKMCARVAGIGQRLARASDAGGAASCDAVVNALLDVLVHPSVTGATDIASLRVSLKTRYLAAVGLASLSAKAEFRRYDK